MLVLSRLPVWLALALTVEEAVRFAFTQLYNKRKNRYRSERFGGLESLVSFSACLIAANRALESERADAYISDPLAAGLCGEEALAARRDLDSRTGPPAAGPTPQPPDAPGSEAGPSGRPIPRLIMRTKFFDDVVSLVTWRAAAAAAAAIDGPPPPPAASSATPQPAGPPPGTLPGNQNTVALLAGPRTPEAPSCHSSLLAACQGAPACLQVVLLGSGLDARPWRLALPPGVRWFEVDRADVLRAKQARLRTLGAQLEPVDPRRGRRRPQQSGDDASGGTEVQPAHALHAASWQCCAADLQRRGWSRGLVARGLDPSAPVLWVLEGLLYYLEEEDVRAVLQEAASVSPRGSVLAASVIRAAQPTTHGSSATPAPSPAPASQGPDTPMAAAMTAAAASAAAPAAAADGAAKDGSGGGSGSTQAQAQGPAAPGPAERAGARYGLQNEFKWKCRGDVAEFFAGCGWCPHAALSWVDAATSYGLPVVQHASGVHFVTGTRA